MIDHHDLIKNLDYDPDTGEWYWKEQNGPKRVGQPAGFPHNQGYISIGFRGGLYLSHRLAWFYMTGYWPENDIDHINGVRDDNRWCNLREATRSENLRNSKTRTCSKSGHKGITWDTERGKWLVQVDHKYIGRYDDIDEAIEASRKYREENHGNFAKI